MNLLSTIAMAIVSLVPLDAFARIWTDNAGKFSVEAKFQGIDKDGRVLLRKDNGNLVKVPIERLSKKDQQYLKKITKEPKKASPKAVSNEELANAIQEVFQASEQGTTARKLLLEKEAFEKFAKKYRQSKITLSFPVKNATPQGKRYRLDLGAPNFPGAGHRGIIMSNVQLTKKEVLDIGRNTRLEISSPVSFNYYRPPQNAVESLFGPFLNDKRSRGKQVKSVPLVAMPSPNTPFVVVIHLLTERRKFIHDE